MSVRTESNISYAEASVSGKEKYEAVFQRVGRDGKSARLQRRGLLFMSLNVDRYTRDGKGSKSNIKWQTLLEPLKRMKDLAALLLQETCWPNERPPHLPLEYEYFGVSQYGDHRGVGIIARRELQPKLLRTVETKYLQMLAVELTDAEGRKYVVMNDYSATSNGDKPTERSELEGMDDLDNAMNELMGDIAAGEVWPHLKGAFILAGGDQNARIGKDETTSGIPGWRSQDEFVNARGRRLVYIMHDVWNLVPVNCLDCGDDGEPIARWTNYAMKGRAVIDYWFVSTKTLDIVTKVRVGDDKTFPMVWKRVANGRYHESVAIWLDASTPQAPKRPQTEDRPLSRSITKDQKFAYQQSASADLVQRHADKGAALTLEEVSDILQLNARIHLQPLMRRTPGLHKKEQRALRRAQRQRRKAAKTFSAAYREHAAAEHTAAVRGLNKAVKESRRAVQIRRAEMLERDRRRRPAKYWREMSIEVGMKKAIERVRARVCIMKTMEDNTKTLLTAPMDVGPELEKRWEALGRELPRDDGKFPNEERERNQDRAKWIREHTTYEEDPKELCADFQELETRAAMKMLPTWTAPDLRNFQTALWHWLGVKILDDAEPCVKAIRVITEAVNSIWTGRQPWPEECMEMRSVGIARKGVDVAADPRQIGICSAVSALMETMLLTRMMNFLEARKAVDPCQHGFRQEMSCDSACLTLQMIIEGCVLRKQPLLVLYLDLEKAYDSTCRHRLTNKLYDMGIRNRALKFILDSAVFRGRRRVCIPGYNEDGKSGRTWTDERGLPQGHRWSPWLYLIDQNDLSDFVRKECEHEPGAGVEYGGKRYYLGLFADDVAALATTIEGMRCIIRAMEKYARLAMRRHNVGKTKLQHFCWNGNTAELKFHMRGEPIEVVQEFVYLGNLIPAKMQIRMNGIVIPGRTERLMSRAGKYVSIFYTARASAHTRVRFLRSNITFAMSILEYGVGVYGDGHHKVATKLLKQMACQALGLARDSSVPTVVVLGELGLWPMQARVRMHILRLFCYLSKPQCNANLIAKEMFEQHKAEYEVYTSKGMLVHRIKEALLWIGKPEVLDRGWNMDIDGNYKTAVYNAVLRDYAESIANLPSMNPEYAALVTGGPITLQRYTNHPDRRVVETYARLRVMQTCLRERTQRWGRHKKEDRNDRICPLCKTEGVPENSRHMLIHCTYEKWVEYRAEAERRISECAEISAHFKDMAKTVAEKPDTWFAIMLCGVLPVEFGPEYNLPQAIIVRRKDDAAKRALRDWESVLNLLGTHVHKWYEERCRIEKDLIEQGF